jgi:BirA family biotin operon repressor/biotin-[acetyl-CoA-carboxylase] ligase
MSSLSTDNVLALLRQDACSRLEVLEVFAEIESTNDYLLAQSCPPVGRYRIAVTENQTAGRGRMNRNWISPPSSGLCMSLAYTFSDMPENIPSLSLALGIGIAQALEGFGVHGVGVKWPNDIVAQGGKLGGILSEVVPAKTDNVTIVVGFGLNVDFRNTGTDRVVTSRLGRAVDMASCCEHLPSRNRILTTLIEGIFDTMRRFEAGGFAPFFETWLKYDWLRGQQVTIETPAGLGGGIADGVDIDGALLVNSEGSRQRFTSGSVTLGRQTGEHP